MTRRRKQTIPQGNPALAIAYMRTSTDDQPNSFEVQTVAMERFAAAHDLEILNTFADKTSGATEAAERPALSAALSAVVTERAGVLLVAKRDRLARDSWISGGIERSLAQYGARVLSADGMGNGTTAADQLMRTILDAAAQHERALIRGRIQATAAVKRARGEVWGAPPLGWKVGADGKTLEQDTGEQAAMMRAHELRAAGFSQRSIAAALTLEGFTTRSGTPWQQGQIWRILARKGPS